MKMKVLGGGGEVGRSAFLIEMNGKRLVLDYGIKLTEKRGEAEYPIDAAQFNVDYLIISHAHLDHSGYIPNFYSKRKVPWLATIPTMEISEILWLDSLKIMGNNARFKIKDIEKALHHFQPLPYNREVKLGNITLKMVDAAHILGSSIVYLEGEKKICYTGDFRISESNLHEFKENIEKCDVLIIETTYFLREQPSRKESEERLIEKVRDVVYANERPLLLPAFAVGRMQELLVAIRKYDRDVEIYLDGMGKEVTKLYQRYARYLKNPRKFLEYLDTVKEANPRRRQEIARKPCVIISTAGMLNGGPALNYLFNLPPGSEVVLTGFCIEGSNGWLLLNKGSVVVDDEEVAVGLPVDYISFSAHATHEDIMRFIEEANPEKIVLVHGDHVEESREFLEEKGFNVVAPKNGDLLTF